AGGGCGPTRRGGRRDGRAPALPTGSCRRSMPPGGRRSRRGERPAGLAGSAPGGWRRPPPAAGYGRTDRYCLAVQRTREVAMKGLMQDVPLTLVHIFERCERYFGAKGIVTASAAGKDWESYADWADRTRRLGGVLDAMGISADGRVATFGWNTARHLELYFAAPCTGRVLHTLNIRLFPHQLTYIVNHAEEEVIFVDRSLAALLFPLLPTFTTVKHLVLMDDGKGDVPTANGLPVHDYEVILAAASPVAFQVDDESTAASMCYTSG